MTRSALILRSLSGFKAMYMLAVLVAPLPPVNAMTLSTAGSLSMVVTSSVSRSFIAWNEVSWSACTAPIKRPVSCCGKNPLGTNMNKKMLRPSVASATIRVSG